MFGELDSGPSYGLNHVTPHPHLPATLHIVTFGSQQHSTGMHHLSSCHTQAETRTPNEVVFEAGHARAAQSCRTRARALARLIARRCAVKAPRHSWPVHICVCHSTASSFMMTSYGNACTSVGHAEHVSVRC